MFRGMLCLEKSGLQHCHAENIHTLAGHGWYIFIITHYAVESGYSMIHHDMILHGLWWWQIWEIEVNVELIT